MLGEPLKSWRPPSLLCKVINIKNLESCKGQIEKTKWYLWPREIIFKIFSNPANDKCGCVGVDKAEVIFLNDLRWSNELIKWNEFLLLLEGYPVHLPASQNHFAIDMCIDKDTPVFATSKDAIKLIGKYNTTDEIENDLMVVRLHLFNFAQPIACEE